MKNIYITKSTKIIEAMKGYKVSINDTGVSIGQSGIKRKDHSIIFTTRNPDEPDYTLVWVSTDNTAAIPGLGRKLPHYGKYSYLAFEGSEPSIVLKGRWPTLNSPMSVPIELSDNKEIPSSLPLQRAETTPVGVVTKLVPRQALAYLPAVFSAKRMTSIISFLADKKMKGKIKYNLLELGKIIGILQNNPDKWLGYGKSANLDETTIERLIKERNEARGSKNFDVADQIRDELKEKGIEIEDTKKGTIWKSI